MTNPAFTHNNNIHRLLQHFKHDFPSTTTNQQGKVKQHESVLYINTKIWIIKMPRGPEKIILTSCQVDLSIPAKWTSPCVILGLSCFFNRATSSEFVSSSIPSWQILTAHPSHPEGPGIWLSVWRFLLTHCLYERAVEVLARLRGCSGSPEPSLLA